jgi:hypothetical protein
MHNKDNKKYCHNISDYRRVFGLMIGVIGLFDTARDYILQYTVTHAHTHTHTHTLLSTVMSSLPFLGSCS